MGAEAENGTVASSQSKSALMVSSMANMQTASGMSRGVQNTTSISYTPQHLRKIPSSIGAAGDRSNNFSLVVRNMNDEFPQSLLEGRKNHDHLFDKSDILHLQS